MRNSRITLFALTVLGGIFVWQNRFAIQRRLEAMGFRTPLLGGSVEDAAQTVAEKARGRMERGATIAEDIVTKIAR